MTPTQLTLRAWYGSQFLRLFHMDARAGTIRQYENTLAIWERVTGNPCIAAIDGHALASFRERCPGAAASVAKHCRHLNHLFAKLGPAGPRNRDALGILTAPPWIKPPRAPGRKPRIPTTEDVAAFVRCAPEDLALFAVVAATTGSRNTAVRALTPDAIDAAGQLLRFPPETDKRHEERIKPIPNLTLAWLRRNAAQMGRWRIKSNSFACRWNRYALQAGVPTLRPHGLKRWWGAQLIRAKATPWCIRFALDHAQRDVTGLAYIDPFDELAGLVDQIALPESFTTRLRRETQATLPF